LDATKGTTESGGVITVDAISWVGSCSGFTTTCAPSSGTGSCSNVASSKTRDDYQPCNFLDSDPILRRAVWNYNLMVREGSLGVHNAAFAIQTLQKTYTDVSAKLGSAATAKSFAADFPNATLR
jgi:hypothetical protein